MPTTGPPPACAARTPGAGGGGAHAVAAVADEFRVGPQVPQVADQAGAVEVAARFPGANEQAHGHPASCGKGGGWAPATVANFAAGGKVSLPFCCRTTAGRAGRW